MEDFLVDGILCTVTNPLCVSHTGSAPYCYDGEVVTVESETYRVYAKYEGHYVDCLFDKSDTEEEIRDRFSGFVRKAVERLKDRK